MKRAYRIIWFLLALVFVAALIGGCALYQSPLAINQPSGSYTAIVPPGTEQPGVWRPDITRLLVCNKTQTVFATIWVDDKNAVPIMELIPEECKFINTDLGEHFLYVEGMVKAGPYGQRSVGSISLPFTTGATSWGYSANRKEVWFYESDFPRLYNSYGGLRGRWSR